MKRVFEGIVFERRRMGDNAIGACTTEEFEEFYQSLPIGKATRITVEDLPESKPEPSIGGYQPRPLPEGTELKPPTGGSNVIKPEPINWLASGGGKSANTSDFKSEPKNCGNCKHDKLRVAFFMSKGDSPRRCQLCSKSADMSKWQPKPAKPQGWEQRFDKEFPHCGGAFKTSLRAFIRAEIERVREEEKQAIVAFLRGHWLMTDGLAPMAGDIERNKHRS